MSKNVRIFLKKIFSEEYQFRITIFVKYFFDNFKIEQLFSLNHLQHFATFDLFFFVKMKLVSTVWVSTSLSKSGYSQRHLMYNDFDSSSSRFETNKAVNDFAFLLKLQYVQETQYMWGNAEFVQWNY
jgi:hypothetical protein